ncbi:MAG: hypothetical protein UV18_C0015G0014 [Candidatus Magasanikbacteria bacterium GW2011_GWC2_42_27]|nr:MAG: hypothetical protein UV18_C0015G0014 [Candidatus Magasanikbacteria bacterium GW2011_GWC2_42_27]
MISDQRIVHRTLITRISMIIQEILEICVLYTETMLKKTYLKWKKDLDYVEMYNQYHRFNPLTKGVKKDVETVGRYLFTASRLYSVAIVGTSLYTKYFLSHFALSDTLTVGLITVFMITSALLVYVFSLYREMLHVGSVAMMWKVFFSLWLIIFFLFNIVQIITLFVDYGWWMLVANVVWGMVGEVLVRKVVENSKLKISNLK